jgi:uncharacterized lipoprotein YbaY/uncharacterized lipoprotein NlpE involved in copper resistance
MEMRCIDRCGFVLAAALLVTTAVAAEIEPPPVKEVITGTATFRERALLPPGALFEAVLEDVSLADAPARQVDQVRIEAGTIPPIEFKLRYDPEAIDEDLSYAVRGRIVVDGRLIMTTDAAVPVLTLGAGSAVELLLVPVGATGPADGGPVGELPASFAGDLPQGLGVRLELHQDRSYYLRTTGHGRGGATVVDRIGSWSLESTSRTLVLWDGDGPAERFHVIDEEILTMENADGELRRDPNSEPLAPELGMTGMYSYMADAGLFTECLTGRKMPVAAVADNAALERAYLEVRGGVGEAVLARIEGRIELLEIHEGGRQPTIVVDRFIEVRPGETCGARGVDAERDDEEEGDGR